ncbi:MAG: glutamine--tRNA ligase/YqeY domain fusion protein [bacterium]|nr:glutamine--tRNA ligase/YqeY domain fusion protein [bacterium]
MPSEEKNVTVDFIRQKINEDLENDIYGGRIHTRFPPEPNGYLHIGHAKSICLNFGIAVDYDGGLCNLRFDDTNPSKEETEYVDSIIEDVKWLGFDWEDRLYYASDYFDKLYEYAVKLIEMGKAYVCSLSGDQIREYRGTLTEPGKNSPYRERSIEENLDLFKRMKDGEFETGEHVLRAKIDMTHSYMVMRDPVIYRILHQDHHRTGSKWCIYPLYDFTHCLSDAIEGITHSLCTLEFENNRAIYDWVLDTLKTENRPRQTEFARLNLNYTIVSKRKLLVLVNEEIVSGWNDPRMLTVSGMRRRGYTPESIRNFCDRIGIAKSNSVVDMALLEFCVREHLNKIADRVMVVLDPVRVVIDNYPDDLEEEFEADNNPEDPEAGKRKVPFSKVLYIEREDFREDPPGKFFRLAPGREVRLKHAYYVKCESFVKNEQTGEITEIHCSYDPKSRGGWSDDGRKVKGTLHWVSEKHALDVETRMYDRLFVKENPEEGDNFRDHLNPDSLKILSKCKAEPGLAGSESGKRLQFLRKGYFCVDPDSTEDKLVFNQTVTLRDSWAKIEKSSGKQTK